MTPNNSSGAFRIPASLDEAKADLNGLAALLTAKQWQRAAIVYAFTEPEQGARMDIAQNRAKLPIRDFARLGIAGLQSDNTVRAYRKAWQSAIDDGHARPVSPGDQVQLPRLPWKDVFGEQTPEVQERVFRAIVNDPERFSSAVRDKPDIAAAVARRAVETPSVRHAVEANLAEPISEREVFERPERTRDYADELVRGINLLIPVVRAVQRGEWQPSPAEAMLLHSLGLLLDQAASPGGEPQDDLFIQIERYLKEGVT